MIFITSVLLLQFCRMEFWVFLKKNVTKKTKQASDLIH
jgi:hypothetical protein